MYYYLLTFCQVHSKCYLEETREIYKHFKREHSKYKSQQWTSKNLVFMMENILYRSERMAVNILIAERSFYNYSSDTYLPFVWSCQQKINAYTHPNHNMNFIMWWHACQKQLFKSYLSKDIEKKLPGLTSRRLKQRQTLK